MKQNRSVESRQRLGSYEDAFERAKAAGIRDLERWSQVLDEIRRSLRKEGGIV